MTDAIYSDPIITPAMVNERSLHDVAVYLADLERDLARPSNAPWFCARAEEFRAIARRACELSQAIDRKAWAKGEAA